MTRQTDATDDESRGTLRRDVLKAVGAGGALAVLGGTAGAQTQMDDDETPEDGTEEEPADGTEGENTVHVVRTLIGPSTNPERPADFFYQPTGLSIEPGDVVKFVFETPDHNVTSYHPAFGMNRRIPSGVEPFSSPLLGWDPNSLPDDIDEPPAESAAEPAGDEEPALVPGDPEQQGDDESETNGNETDAGEPADAGAVSGDGEPRPDTWLHAFETPGVYDMECAPHETFGMALRVVVGEETETDFETSDAEALPEPRAGPVGLARVTLTDPALEPENIVEQGEVLWEDLEATQAAGPGTPTEEPTDGETPAEAETPETATAEAETPEEELPGADTDNVTVANETETAAPGIVDNATADNET